MAELRSYSAEYSETLCPKQNKELDSSSPPCTSQPLDPATAPRAWRHNIQCLLMTFRVLHPKDCSLDLYLCDSGCSDRADSALLGTPSLPFFHFWLWLRFQTPTMSPHRFSPVPSAGDITGSALCPLLATSSTDGVSSSSHIHSSFFFLS